jgi:hypothetical protein
MVKRLWPFDALTMGLSSSPSRGRFLSTGTVPIAPAKSLNLRDRPKPALMLLTN